MSHTFIAENKASRARLKLLADRLTKEDLTLVTPYGWTIGALFAHMAWWDQRVLVLVRRWNARGVDESPVDSEAINDALRPLCHAMNPDTAVQLCLETAEQTDAELASLSAELQARIESSPNHFRFDRSLHRNDHIHDIESLVPRTRVGA